MGDCALDWSTIDSSLHNKVRPANRFPVIGWRGAWNRDTERMDQEASLIPHPA